MNAELRRDDGRTAKALYDGLSRFHAGESSDFRYCVNPLVAKSETDIRCAARYTSRMLAQWLKDALNHADMTQVDLAKRLTEKLGQSYDKAAINKMAMVKPTAKTKPRTISAAELMAIAEITKFPAPRPELSRHRNGDEFPPDPDFDDGDRSPVISDDLTSLGVSTIRPFSGTIEGSSPDIDTSVGAGPGGIAPPAVMQTGEIVYAADAVRGEILLPGYLLSEFTRAKAPRVHWIKVRGDSMEPTLLPGERVMVDTTDTTIGQGGVFVVRDPDGEIIVKRLRKLKDGLVELVSDNPKQQPIIYVGNEIAVIGRVVGRLARI
ncbi:S24 family peptidase [Kaistia algarum]|uniref:S24 family peptidase n=1 Tax=Kaistia algarum TaxID=2083279 RepID=UPI001403D558|nr:helix-turn-helix transcriptional regulator [Kaistia algarum]MCX5513441.1 helix-turn-helix transcriptional regulator [Kaistia algarum]